MLKENLLTLMENNDIFSLKDILINEIIKSSYKAFDSRQDKNINITFDNQVEEWKNYGKKYQISNLGRVKYYGTPYIIPQINKNKDLYLDKPKWEEKCKKYNITTSNISNDSKVYYTYIKPLWLDEKKENEKISERELAEKTFSQILQSDKNNYLIIHHINDNENDNRIINLIYIPNSFHLEIHAQAKIVNWT